MFTQAELLKQLPKLVEQVSPHIERVEYTLERVEYTQYDFKHPESEGSIVIHCGARTAFQGALQFWMHSVRSLGDQDLGPYFLTRLAKSGKFAGLAATDFYGLAKRYSHDLVSPLILSPKGEFISAMQIYDDWDDIAILAEFQEEYISFYWSTTT